MNALRLIFGWIFLAGLTAAGTFYGMDEVDSRFGLASAHLHEKFGITRYAAVRKVTPVTPVSPTPVTPSPTDPTKPSTYTDPHAVTPDPGPSTPIVPPSPGPSTPVSPVSPPPSPTYPVTPTPAPRTVPAAPAPRSVPEAPSRPRDFNEVNDRYLDVKSRSDAEQQSWAAIARSSPYGIGRAQPTINKLKNYTQAAESALRLGDTASARHDLDLAEQQLDILQKLRDQ